MAGKDLAEIDLLAVEADAAAGGHRDGPVVEGIVEVRQPLGLGPGKRRVIMFGSR